MAKKMGKEDNKKKVNKKKKVSPVPRLDRWIQQFDFT